MNAIVLRGVESTPGASGLPQQIDASTDLIGRATNPVVLVVLGYIDKKTSRLNPQGGYNPETLPSGRRFETMEIAGELRPCRNYLYGDFRYEATVAARCVRTLQQSAPRFRYETPGGSNVKGSWPTKSGRIAFRHQLFERNEQADDDGEYMPLTYEQTAIRESWRFPSTIAQERFANMNRGNERFHITPLPAYAANNTPIQPHDYQRELAGAYVEMFFTLKHQEMRESNTHTFNADVVRINVLVPPLRQMRSRRRVKAPATSVVDRLR
ncbi:hypothetical protein K525DRAFT_187569 [Schizophyllum commune Loenen D]|nr:hypothetical protein K525DRAFT_187569 [Schizophyllum commune Loenen D]